MNVALTRAKFKLILIGRIESLVRNVHWKAYIDDCAGKKQLIRVDESYFSKTSSASGIKESLGASALEDINLKETTNNYCEQRRRIDNIDSTNSYTPHGFTNRLHNSPANSSSAPVTSSGTTLFNSGTRRDDYISGSPPRKYNSYSNSPGGDSEQHFPSKHHYNVANRSRNHEREDSSKHSPKNTDTRRDIFKGGSIKSSKLKRRRTSYASPHSFTLRKRAIFYKAEAYNTHHTKRAKRRTRDGGSGNPSITDPPV
jgi:ATP-dependent exoDNAse (exonuclease V) beta subunit